MNDESRGKKLLKKGTEIVGSAVGGALGFLAGGPIGAAGGAVAGTVCGQILSEVADRMLSEKEQIRVGATAAIALSSIQERLENGERLREDHFFDQSDCHQSTAEELFEGVLLKARDEHEEKKVKILGRLYSNVTFDATCSKQEGNYLINIGNSLTYTQMCLLNIYNNKHIYSLRNTDLKAGELVTYASLSCLHQSFELFRRGYLLLQKPGEDHHTLVLDLNQITPAQVSLTVTGNRIYQMLSLNEIEKNDLIETASYLQTLL